MMAADLQTAGGAGQDIPAFLVNNWSLRKSCVQLNSAGHCSESSVVTLLPFCVMDRGRSPEGGLRFLDSLTGQAVLNQRPRPLEPSPPLDLHSDGM